MVCVLLWSMRFVSCVVAQQSALSSGVGVTSMSFQLVSIFVKPSARYGCRC